MAIQGTNRALQAQYLPIGDTSAPTPSTGLVMDASGYEPYPTGWEAGELVRPAWWRIQSDTSRWLAVDTQLSMGTNMDTVLTIYWRNPATGVWQEIVNNDDTGGLGSKVTFYAGVGVTYYAQVLNYDDTPLSAVYVLRVQPSTAPAATWEYLNSVSTPSGSDSFAGAELVSESTGFGSVDATSATLEVGEPVLYTTGSGGDGMSRWWKFTASKTGLVRIGAGRGGIAVFTGTTLANLELVQCRFGPGNSFDCYTYVTGGVTYYIRWFKCDAIFSSTGVAISNILPVTETVIPFANARQRTFSDGSFVTGPGQIVGGVNALKDGSDSTFVDVYKASGADNERSYAVDIPATAVSDVLDIQVRLRAKLNGGIPSWGNRGASFNYITSTTSSSAFYSPMDWLWKSDVLRDRIISLRNAAGVLQINTEMIGHGPYYDPNTEFPNHYPPHGWGTQYPYLDALVIGSGSFTHATITEGALVVYSYAPVAPETPPPDSSFVIAGQLDSTRVRPYIR